MKAFIVMASLFASLVGGSIATANQGDGHNNDNDFWIEWNCKQAGGYWDGFSCDMNYDWSRVTCYAKSIRGQTYGVNSMTRHSARAQRAALNNCAAASGHACRALGCVAN
jgi:hypothetical protein